MRLSKTLLWFLLVCGSSLSFASVTFVEVQDWGSGMQGQITIDNTSDSAMLNWSLQFSFPGSIDSIFNATSVSHTGNTYDVTNAGYNSTIAANSSVSFGFVAEPGGLAADNFVLSYTSPTPPPPPPPPSPKVTFTDDEDWGQGMDGQITITNPGSSPIANWNLQFNLDGSITSIWDASISSKNGDSYYVVPKSYDSTIPGGGSVTFGFDAAPGGITPSDFVLDGKSLAETPEPSFFVVVGLVLGGLVVRRAAAGAPSRPPTSFPAS